MSTMYDRREWQGHLLVSPSMLTPHNPWVLLNFLSKEVSLPEILLWSELLECRKPFCVGHSFSFMAMRHWSRKIGWGFRGHGQRLSWSVTFLKISASWSLKVLRDFLTMSGQQQRLQWVLKKHLLESGLWHAYVHLRMALPILGHFMSSMLVALKAWQGLGNLYQGSWS